jgi:hypothetical protein
MRRFFLCFLLCLMPLRLWAGAWMPMVQSGSQIPTMAALHHSMPPAAVDVAADAVVAHDCHEDTAQAPAAAEGGKATGECHEASCQLCGVCHQSANLAWWPWALPVFQSDALPVGESHQPAGQAFSPPIKPPIS